MASRARRERVRKEVFKGTEIKGAHRSGSEWAAMVILAYAATAYSLYAWSTNPLTGFALGEHLGAVTFLVPAGAVRGGTWGKLAAGWHKGLLVSYKSRCCEAQLMHTRMSTWCQLSSTNAAPVHAASPRRPGWCLDRPDDPALRQPRCHVDKPPCEQRPWHD